MANAAQIRANGKYDKANTTGFYLKLNNKTDSDIIAYMKTVDNKQGLVKQLIREYMARSVPDSVSVPDIMKDLENLPFPITGKGKKGKKNEHD